MNDAKTLEALKEAARKITKQRVEEMLEESKGDSQKEPKVSNKK